MLKFNENGKFRILQLADIQETVVTNPDTVNFIRAAIEYTKPDLIVLTGDQIKGYGIYMKFGDIRKNFIKALDNILSPIRDSDVPFCAVFGNHDEEKSATKQWQWEIYKSYGALGEDIPNIHGTGNFYLNIASHTSDDTVFRIYCFDSCTRVEPNLYPYVTENQLDAYKKVRDEYFEAYDKYCPALAFQHIPVREVYDILRLTDKKHGYKGASDFNNGYYTLGEVDAGGFMGENAAVPSVNSGEFEVLSEKGDVLGLFFGHDHNNSFVGELNGMKLGYTQGCGFHCYGPGLDRGVRYFDLDEKDLSKFTTGTVTYREVLGTKLKRPVIEHMYTHSPSSVSTAIPFFGKRLALAAGVSIAVTGISHIKKAYEKNN